MDCNNSYCPVHFRKYPDKPGGEHWKLLLVLDAWCENNGLYDKRTAPLWARAQAGENQDEDTCENKAKILHGQTLPFSFLLPCIRLAVNGWGYQPG